jgi:hypothetical protein
MMPQPDREALNRAAGFPSGLVQTDGAAVIS